MKLLIYVKGNKAGYLNMKLLTQDERIQMAELARISEAELKDMVKLMKDTKDINAGVSFWEKFKDIIKEEPFNIQQPEIVPEPEKDPWYIRMIDWILNLI